MNEYLKVFGGEFVILDLETTGLVDAAIVEIAVINQDGDVLLNQRVNPTPVEIEDDAFAIHGISSVTVSDCPTFDKVYQILCDVLLNKHLVIYNVAYDWPIIKRRCGFYDLDIPVVERITCAMLEYSAFVGDWNDYHESYRWQKLPGGDHSAVGDCLSVLSIIKKMVSSE